MNNWSTYIEREVKDVLAELIAQGYCVESDELGIYSYRNIILRKEEMTIELICVPLELEEFEGGKLTTEEVHWFVDDIFEADKSYREENSV